MIICRSSSSSSASASSLSRRCLTKSVGGVGSVLPNPRKVAPICQEAIHPVRESGRWERWSSISLFVFVVAAVSVFLFCVLRFTGSNLPASFERGWGEFERSWSIGSKRKILNWNGRKYNTREPFYLCWRGHNVRDRENDCIKDNRPRY